VRQKTVLVCGEIGITAVTPTCRDVGSTYISAHTPRFFSKLLYRFCRGAVRQPSCDEWVAA